MLNVRWAQAALLAVGLSACAHSSFVPNDQTLPTSDNLAETRAPAQAATNTRYMYLVSGSVEHPDSGAVVAYGNRCEPWADVDTKLCDLPALATRSTP